MASKSIAKKADKLFSYKEYIDKFCPNIAEDELLTVEDPSIVGTNLAKMTIEKIKHQITLR